MRKGLMRTWLLLIAALAAFMAGEALAGEIGQYNAGGIKILRLKDKPGGIPEKVLVGEKAKVASGLEGGICPNEFASFLLVGPGEAVLIDSGNGAAGGGKTLDLLRQTGFPPEKIKHVYLTHMHPDHIAGMMANGAKTFPEAKIHVARAEYDYWNKNSGEGNFSKIANDFIELYKNDLVFFDEGDNGPPWLKPLAVPGHTPGHVVFSVENDGSRYLVGGDVIHCLAAQAKYPEITTIWDVDQDMARQSRLKFLKDAAASNSIVLGGHFPSPGAVKFIPLEEDRYDYTTILPEKEN